MSKRNKSFQRRSALNIAGSLLLVLPLSWWAGNVNAGVSKGVCGLPASLPNAKDSSKMPSGLIMKEFPNDAGKMGAFHDGDDPDVFNEEGSSFFADLGTNQRTCGTCHLLSAAGGIDVPSIQNKFIKHKDPKNKFNKIFNQGGTNPLDPLFRPNDGSWTEDLGNRALLTKKDPNYVDPCIAYNNLVEHGLIKIVRSVPANAEFTVEVLEPGVVSGIEIWPEGVAQGTTGPINTVTAYRRPLPSSNLGALNDDGTVAQDFSTSVMWDKRETLDSLGGRKDFKTALLTQFKNATKGHAQFDTSNGEDVLDSDAESGVAFEMGLFSAQNSIYGKRTNEANDKKNNLGPFATGGAQNVLASSQSTATTKVFDLFDAWQDSTDSKKLAVWKGQEIFNGNTLLATPSPISGAIGPAGCTACHSRHNIGSSIGFIGDGIDPGFNIGLHSNTGLDFATGTVTSLPTEPPVRKKLIKYKLKLKDGGSNFCGFGPTGPAPIVNPRLDGETEWVTTDPGMALTTGKWCNIDDMKTPQLRGLHHKPYFSNGAGTDLTTTVTLYQGFLGITFTSEELKNLVAFLEAL